MKHMYLAALIIIAAVLLIACGNNRPQNGGTVPLPPGAVSRGAASPFLYDIDYMRHVFENDFALLDVARWAHGVYIHEIFNNMYQAVLANPGMDADQFYAALNRYFAPMSGIGNFVLISPNHYNSVVANHSFEQIHFSGTARSRLREPHVAEFYRLRYPETRDAAWWEEFLEVLHAQNNPEQAIDRALGLTLSRLRRNGGEFLANELYNALLRADAMQVYLLLSNEVSSFWTDVPFMTAEVLEEGHIAYIFGRQFLAAARQCGFWGFLRRNT